MFRSIATTICLLFVFACLPLGAQNTVTCQYTFINVPGAAGTAAQKLNANGTVVGVWLDSNSFQTRGFIDQNGVITTFRAPNSGDTQTLGINDHGDTVGFFDDNTGTHGFLLSNSGAIATINVPGSTSTEASGINDQSQIVGSFHDSSNTLHGFLLQNGQFTTVDFPGATATSAAGINNTGVIVGIYAGSDQQNHGFILNNGQFTTIDVPGATDTEALAVNNLGEVVGLFRQGSPAQGFIFKDGTISIVTPPPNTFSQSVAGVNDRGVISGALVLNTNGPGSEPGYTATCQ